MNVKYTVHDSVADKDNVTIIEGFKSTMNLDDIRAMGQDYAELTANGTLTAIQKGGEYEDVTLE